MTLRVHFLFQKHEKRATLYSLVTQKIVKIQRHITFESSEKLWIFDIKLFFSL